LRGTGKRTANMKPEVMTKQAIIAAIRECAKELGRSPSFIEVMKMKGVSRKQVRWHFGDFRKALKACGLEGRHGGYGSQIEMESLFKDWARVVRELGRVPSQPEYTKLGKYSQTPLLTRFGVWSNVPPAMKMVMKQQGWEKEWKDVLGAIEEYLRGKAAVAGKRFRVEELPTLCAQGAQSVGNAANISGKRGQSRKTKSDSNPTLCAKSAQRMGHPANNKGHATKIEGPHSKQKDAKAPDVYGHIMRPGPMLCAPTNEQGVLFLFGAMAEKLGFGVLVIRSAYPDCIALMRMDEESCRLVKIEFEKESKNFLRHMHDKSDADIIVCWKHNWPECPLEVVELGRWF
jgi:hypothetical protein